MAKQCPPDDMAVPVVVVGVDGSDRAVSALAAAARLVAAAGGRVVAVHVKRVSVLASAGPVTGAGTFAVTADDIADQCHLDCELVLAGTRVPWTFEVRHGDPAVELNRAATEHDAACIAIGRSPPRRLGCLRRGSIMARLVDRAQRPVLVIPPQQWP
jgi:nucleotide-binding universal stress UspA family protein